MWILYGLILALIPVVTFWLGFFAGQGWRIAVRFANEAEQEALRHEAPDEAPDVPISRQP